MNDLLVLVIVIAVIANIILIAGAVVYARSRRAADEPVPVAPWPEAAPAPASDTTVSPSVTLPPVPLPAAAAASPLASDDAGVGDAEPEAGVLDMHGPPAQESDVNTAADELSAFLDPLTGLATMAGWEHVLDIEEGRLGRYGRPATVVVVELDRLDALADRLGADVADRLIPAVAQTIRRSARAADVVARTDRATFRVLMPETDEIRAINFVERLRETCDTWLEASAVAVRLAIGWASAGPGGDIRAAARTATERMYADRARGRPAPGRPPTVAS